MTASAALAFSLLTVGYWAFWNFHRPHAPDVLRYSVTLRRYLLGVTLYILAALAVFALALLCAHVAQRSLLPEIRSPEARTGLPLAAALLVTVLLPRLPGTRFLADEMRRLLQSLALFPASSERMSRLLAASGCQPDEASRAALRKEMEVFGLPADALDRIYPPPAVARLDETHALHLRVDAIFRQDGPAASTRARRSAGLTWRRRLAAFARSLGAAVTGWWRDLAALARAPGDTAAAWRWRRRLAAFTRARGVAIEEARLEHLRLLRRVARATLLAGEFSNSPKPEYAEEEHPGIEALCEFIVEESRTVAARYHRLVADAALSMFHRRSKREAFLGQLGFPTPPPLVLPFASVVLVAAIIPATAALSYVRFLLEWAGLLPGPSRPPPSALVVLSFSILQLIIVLWAVLPKALTRWAWPRQGTPPLGSYALSAVGAFASQAALGWLLVAGEVIPETSQRFGISSMKVMLIFSLFAVVSTLGLCLLIDHRLLDDRFRFTQRRWLDGLALATAMGGADILVVRQLITWLDGVPPDGVQTAIMAALGFALGWLVPSSVAAWLNHHLAQDAPGRQAAARPSHSLATAQGALR